MNTTILVTMANQIGTFFDSMTDRDEGLRGLSDHIRRFWAPPMRVQITAHLQAGGEGLSSIVRAAIEAHPVLATPTPFDPDELPKPAQRHEFDGASES
ncbi:MAG: formate dehydrogenase subunit delta [Burkholderiaceae bacterium]